MYVSRVSTLTQESLAKKITVGWTEIDAFLAADETHAASGRLEREDTRTNHRKLFNSAE